MMGLRAAWPISYMKRHDSGAGGTPHRYWRVKVTGQNLGGTAGYIRAAEIQMRTTSGGADQCTGGTAMADSFYAPEGLTAANAFDDSIFTDWASNGTGNNSWIGYDLGAGNAKDIVEVAWTVGNDASQVPTDVTIDYSDDGSTWTPKWSETGLVFHASGTTTTMSP